METLNRARRNRVIKSMRTHIVTTLDIPTANAALVRKPVQPGDRLIFQTEADELTVTATQVQTEPGLMKGWVMATWEKEVANG